MSLFGRPTLPKDEFEFNQIKLFLSFDRKEKITEWNYLNANGPNQVLELAGLSIIGLTLQQAWLKSVHFEGLAHGIYWQLGRLLGYWQVSHGQLKIDPLLCRCFNITQSEVLKKVVDQSQTDLISIGQSTKAGLGCGECQKDILETIQRYCDQHAFVVENKCKPLGLNPINFLIRMEAFFEKWKVLSGSQLEIEFLGQKDYTIFAKWSESQTDSFKSFIEFYQSTLEVKLIWKNINFIS